VPLFAPLTYTSSDGLSLYARDYPGSGGPAHLPVICIHGLTRNSLDFDELAPLVSELGRRVLAVDVRGRGHSARDPNPANYTPAIYAADVVALMHALGIARAVFIGTSMGGLVTMSLASTRLDLIAGAVLNDVGPVLSKRGLARIAGYAGKPAMFTSWEEAAGHVRAINECAFPGAPAAEWAKWARRAFEQRDDGLLCQRYDPGIASSLHNGRLPPTSLASRMAFRRLARHRPTLLVRGALSDLVEPEQAAWMRRAAPGLAYTEVPGVGHAPMLTEPDAFDALRDFLARLP